jgi:branched-subunit amino acid aminotransferase/4-amino-4-deoxychorismate lyase
MQVWINGHFHDANAATVGFFDAGFQHGVGLFETLRARDGVVFRPLAHLERLRESAMTLRLVERLNIEAIAEAVEVTLERNGLRDARVRVTLTGGDLNILARAREGSAAEAMHPTIAIVAQPPTPYPEAMFAEGVRVMVAEGRMNPWDPMAGHKTLSYWPRLLALQQAAAHGCGEALWFDVANALACGCVSNAFIVKDGIVRTPVARGDSEPSPIPSAVLPGITRAFVIEAARARGMEIRIERISVDDILGADECFLTNASWGVLPVTRLEQEAIGRGEPGDVAATLREVWIEAGIG